MGKLARFTQKLFGSTAGTNQLAKFGSFAAGTPVRYDGSSVTPTNIQALSNYLEGWFAAVDGENAPAIEDMNALCYLFAYQLCYIFQQGTAEWDSGTTYFTNSFASKSGVIYMSLSDNNTGNDPSSDTVHWKAVDGNLITTLGDILYGNSLGTPTRLAGNTTTVREYLTSTGTGSAANAPAYQPLPSPTVTKLTGSGTYTVPAGTSYLKFRMAGPGGGGASSPNGGSTGGNAGGAGSGPTTLSAHGGGVILSAPAGGGGATLSGAPGAGGGAPTINSPAIDLGSYAGAGGDGATHQTTLNPAGGMGGVSPFGGAGRGGSGLQTFPASGGNAVGSGSGGGGGGSAGNDTEGAGTGGGSGSYIHAMIPTGSVAASYDFSVGTGGGGGASTSGTSSPGGNGGDGVIWVEAYQ